MGPGDSTPDTPDRPLFTWDIKTVPWTDGVGDQTLYVQSVQHWSAFHDNLSEANSNNISPKNRGVVLLSHLFSHTAAVCRTITKEILDADDGTDLILDAVQKKDALSVVLDVYAQLQQLFSTVRRGGENLRLFEARFNAQLHRFNALESATALSEAVSALFLLNNGNVDNSQRISILAAASPSSDGLSSRSYTAAFIASVRYESVGSVVRLCDSPPSSSQHQLTVATAPHQAMAAQQPSASQRRRGASNRSAVNRRAGQPQKLTRQSQKNRSPCVRCGQYGHCPEPLEVAPFNAAAPRCQPRPAVAPPAEAVKRDQAAGDDNVLAFNLAHLVDAIQGIADVDTWSSCEAGPMLDNGAPYSAIGYLDPCSLESTIGTGWSGSLEPIPAVFANCPFWQYGTAEHHSEARPNLGSVVLSARACDGTQLRIRHLVLQGSSQWVVGRNVTSRADILHVDECCLRTIGKDGAQLHLPLLDRAYHLFPPLDLFVQQPPAQVVLSADAVHLTSDWPALRRVVDRVHLHVCGHSSLDDMRTLLQRTGKWNDDVSKVLMSLVSRCSACRATSRPKPSRKVSLSSLNRRFNDVVCVDHFFLDVIRVFHAMDAASRYSAGTVYQDLCLASAIHALESEWLSPFWAPRAIQSEGSFAHFEFVDYIAARDIAFRPVPPRRHSKNVLESKHGVIRSVFLRLLSYDPQFDHALAAQQAIRVSNDLYGSHVLSAFELAHGFSRPHGAPPVSLPPDVFEAQATLSTKRKLPLILLSKPIIDIPLATGDLVDVYVRQEGQKRGKWSSPRSVLSVDRAAWTVTVPSSHGRTLSVAIEDVRPSIGDDSLAALVRAANDVLDVELDACSGSVATVDPKLDDDLLPNATANYDGTLFKADYGSDDATPSAPTPVAGDRLEIHWPLDNAYYPGVVSDTAPRGRHVIVYDDGDSETLDLSKEAWSFHLSTVRSIPTTSALQSDVPAVLSDRLTHFGNRPFMLHEAQVFPPYATRNAYCSEELAIERTVSVTPISLIPAGANVISSHTIYKVKVEEDHLLMLKARIAPHGNEDSFKHDLSSDCSMCSRVEMRIILSTASLRKWRFSKLDVKSAFLQIGKAEREVYVLPPCESSDRGRCAWLLLTAVYGLINANAKWQVLSHTHLTDIGFRQTPVVPQLFVQTRNFRLVAIIAKIVDDLLLAAPPSEYDAIIVEIRKKVELGTIAHGPGQIRYFGLNIVQLDDYSTMFDGDDKLAGIAAMPISRLRLRELDAPICSVEAKAFASMNSTVGWLGNTSSPFCAAFASIISRLRHPLPCVTILAQVADLRTNQALGSSFCFPRPVDAAKHSLSVTVFSDAGRSPTNGYLCYVAGLLLGELVLGSIYHVLSWSSHKSKRPVRSIGAAEILVAGEAIDEGKIIAHVMSIVLGVRVPLHLVVDSKDQYTSLSTKCNSVDKSIRADVNCIRFEFEHTNVSRIIWVPEKLNLADPGTKSDIPLASALQLTMVDGRLALSFDRAEACDADRPLG